MAEIVGFIVIGIVVGAIARLVTPGPDAIGILGTIAVGIVAAVVGGYLWSELFGDTRGVEWIGSILVAMGLLLLIRRSAWGRRTVV